MKDKIAYGIFVILLLFFFTFIFAEKLGYYTPQSTKTKALTEEQIKLFEEDIKNGKEIDVTKYTNNLKKDYSNNLSKGIYKVSLRLESFIDKSIKSIFKSIEKSMD